MSIEVKDLSKEFGKRKILKSINLVINPGEVVGLIGPNGAGKSTLMKCISRLIFPTSGEVLINGIDIVKNQNALKNISSLIENPGLFPEISGINHLNLYASLHKTSSEHFKKVVEIIGLGERLRYRAGSYSMGMKQRLALGIVLMSNPQFLILDEPFVGLDPEGVLELRRTVSKLAEEGKGILISSHQLLDLEKITTRNIFIREGSIVEDSEIEKEVSSFKIMIEDRMRGKEFFLANSKDGLNFYDNYFVFKTEDLSLLNTFLSELNQNKILIKSVIPIEKDLESIYKNLYEEQRDEK